MKFCIFCHSVLGLTIPLRTVSEHEKGNKMRYTIISNLNSWFGEIIRYDKLILLLYHILFTGQNFILWSRLEFNMIWLRNIFLTHPSLPSHSFNPFLSQHILIELIWLNYLFGVIWHIRVDSQWIAIFSTQVGLS